MSRSTSKGSRYRIKEEKVTRERKRVSVWVNLLLLLISALLFALSFPSFLSVWGWFPLAFVALIPVFIVVHRSSWKGIAFYGIFFGLASYTLFNFWLGKFHPLALFIVPPIYAFYFLLVFPALKIIDSAFPRYGYILQTFVWLAYEFLKTQGFLGYSYGIMGYSQYLFKTLIQIAEITGVWGVSLIVVFPSVLLGNALKEWDFRFRSLPEMLGGRGRGAYTKAHINVIKPGIIYLVVFVGVLVYGFVSQVDYGKSRMWKVALIQQNVDPWKGGTRPYERSLNILLKLSRQATKENPDIIVWSETSFVPGIDWHTKYRTDVDKYLLVKRLVDYLKKQKIPYVIGNDDGQLAKNERGEDIRVDYNATVLYMNGRIVKTYRKLHLVPFTEYFPFKKTLPRVYQWLVNADTHFWKKGKEYTVFEADGVRFSTPICFEDTFGYLNREFVRHGADVIVNMTNDSWSFSVAAEMQHMNMAVFRAVENRRSVVRSTNGGITCTIDPNGKILDMLEPFTEGYLISKVPVYNEKETIYTKWGDWMGIAGVIIAIAGVIVGLLFILAKHAGRSKD